MLALAALFLPTALLYSSVGFGGGSTYNALLVLSGTDYRAIPTISLVCNILVVGVGCWRFARDGNVPWSRMWPLILLSVPMAWLGGRTPVPERAYVGLLAAALALSGIAMLWQPERVSARADMPKASPFEPVIGGALGYLSGLVGIGGGIFLAPILYLLRWGGAKAIAGTCAAFIFVNSIAGLAGQLGKDDGFNRVQALGSYWLLFPSVVIGGLLGSALGSGRLRPAHVRYATAVLVLYVAVRLGLRYFELGSAGGQ
jgi:uncharacterized protein